MGPSKILIRQLYNSMQSFGKRGFATSRRTLSQEWQQYGVPGSNLPFDISNKAKLTFLFILFFASGLNAPFLLARRHFILANKKEPELPPQELSKIYCFGEEGEEEMA